MREGLMIYSIILVLGIVSCQKQPPAKVLPSKTYSGDHTLGFLANGEVWIPYDRGSYEAFELPKAQLDSTGALKISASRIVDEKKCRNWFCLEVEKGCLSPGIYSLSNLVCNAPYQTFFYGSNGDKPGITYEIDPSQPHELEVIHLDKRNHIIAGTFHLDLLSLNGERIKIRSGRFDLIYE